MIDVVNIAIISMRRNTANIQSHSNKYYIKSYYQNKTCPAHNASSLIIAMSCFLTQFRIVSNKPNREKCQSAGIQ